MGWEGALGSIERDTIFGGHRVCVGERGVRIRKYVQTGTGGGGRA